MDTICVLEQGRIVESGNHGDLLRRQGYYWQLHQSGILLDEAA
jgi:ABC-type multidrug transport system fused ATPase/permease subunit